MNNNLLLHKGFILWLKSPVLSNKVIKTFSYFKENVRYFQKIPMLGGYSTARGCQHFKKKAFKIDCIQDSISTRSERH